MRRDIISSNLYDRIEVIGRSLYSGLGASGRAVSTRLSATGRGISAGYYTTGRGLRAGAAATGRGLYTGGAFVGHVSYAGTGYAGLAILSAANGVGLSSLRIGMAAVSNAGTVALLRGIDGILTSPGMIKNSVVTTPLFLNRGVAMTIDDISEKQAFVLGAIFEGFDSIPTATMDVFLRLSKAEARGRRGSPDFEKAQAHFEALIGEAGQTIRQLVEENAVRSFERLNIERIAEDTHIRLSVTDAHHACEPFNREIKRLNDLREVAVKAPASTERERDITALNEQIAAVQNLRMPIAQPIADAYKKLLQGYVGEEDTLGFDPKCSIEDRTPTDRANREIKRLVRMVARDIDSFAHHYLPDELNRFATPQAVENGQKAIVLATDYLDELWRAKRSLTFSEVMHESGAIWGEYIRSLRRPSNRQEPGRSNATRTFRRPAALTAPASDPLTRHMRRAGAGMGPLTPPPEPQAAVPSLQEVEMTAASTAFAGQTTAAVARQEARLRELTAQMQALEAKIDLKFDGLSAQLSSLLDVLRA